MTTLDNALDNDNQNGAQEMPQDNSELLNPELSENAVVNFTEQMENAWKRGDEAAFLYWHNVLYPAPVVQKKAPRKSAPRKAAAKTPTA